MTDPNDRERQRPPSDPAASTSSTRREWTVDEYVDGVRARDVPILARAITLMESNQPLHQTVAEDLLARLLPYTGNAMRVGITGSPGVGKSTFIESLGLHLISQRHSVAVLAVDPSSRISGGSILGDKTRMTRLSSEPNAFIRPSPAAGTLGGVARRTRESMLVCEAAGFDIVLIETVGIGQSETMVADMTDCFLTLMLPGAGDELQGIKRGLLELVDVIAVNKADGPNQAAAELAARQLELALTSRTGRDDRQGPIVLTCSALHQLGVDAVWNAIVERFTQRKESGALETRRRRQNLQWLWSIVENRLFEALRAHPAVQSLQSDLEHQVLKGLMHPETAARKLLDTFLPSARTLGVPSVKPI